MHRPIEVDDNLSPEAEQEIHGGLQGQETIHTVVVGEDGPEAAPTKNVLSLKKTTATTTRTPTNIKVILKLVLVFSFVVNGMAENDTINFKTYFPLCQIKVDPQNLEQAYDFFQNASRQIHQIVLSPVENPDWHNEKYVIKLTSVSSWQELNDTTRACKNQLYIDKVNGASSQDLMNRLKFLANTSNMTSAILLPVFVDAKSVVKYAITNESCPKKTGSLPMPTNPSFVAISNLQEVNFLDYNSFPSLLKANTYVGCMYKYTHLSNGMLKAYQRKISDNKLILYQEVNKAIDQVSGSNKDCMRVFIELFRNDKNLVIPKYLSPQNKEEVYQIIKIVNDNLIHFINLLRIIQNKRWDIDLIPSNIKEFFSYLFSGEGEEILLIIMANIVYFLLLIICCCYCIGRRSRSRTAEQTLRAIRR